jgi:hypothetical protein
MWFPYSKRSFQNRNKKNPKKRTMSLLPPGFLGEAKTEKIDEINLKTNDFELGHSSMQGIEWNK